MKRWIVAVLGAVLAHAAVAAGPNEIRKQAEGSMLVTGWIDISPDGSVHDYTLDRPDRIPAGVTDLIQKNVPAWKFQVDGNPNVIERTRMNVRVVAKRVDDTHDSIAIKSATFGDSNPADGQSVSHKSMQAPKYPRSAVEARVDGTVYLYLRVGRQGQVEDAVAEQVNLGVYGSDMQMRHYRDVLADAALDAAKQWTFNPPTTGKHIDDAYWDVRVPVAFNLKPAGAPPVDNYGKWQVYIPGPRQPVPWLKSGLQVTPTSDAVPEGSISQVNQDLRLLTPLEGA
jgi:hypothetical protein